MSIVSALQSATASLLQQTFQLSLAPGEILVNETKPEFEGDYTLVLFALAKPLKQSPEMLGETLGKAFVQQHPQLVSSYNVIKGFLNLVITDDCIRQFLQQQYGNPVYGQTIPHHRKVMVEYSSPNTNKPLHLGHLRNNFLGWSLAALYQQQGYDVVKTSILNDRGIHICKSMVAWQFFAEGATPESKG
ncbi:MAG: arginine--tRNA ligase, partial [Chitinophagaceae bacterium]